MLFSALFNFKMKFYAVLKTSYDENSGIELRVDCLCASEEEAHEVIDKEREHLESLGWEETECNIALSMFNPLNELEYYHYEIQEMEVKANA